MVFRVGITGDFAPGSVIAGWIEPAVAEHLGGLKGLEWEFLPPDDSLTVAPEIVSDFDAVISGDYRWTRTSFKSADRLMLVACWGIGVDGIDLQAATDADVAVTNSPSPGNHASVAESALTFILALSKLLLTKDRLTKAGRAGDAQAMRGTLIRGRTIGIVGLGNTARLFSGLLRALAPARVLSYDPYVDREVADSLGVQLVGLEALMEQADYVVVMCTLNDETRGLVSAELLARMKPTAYLVNTARGPLVDQAALVELLRGGAIAGAAVDVTDPEPPSADDPLLALDNVIATGHALAWTEESLRGACDFPCRAVATAYRGTLPDHVVNLPVAERARFQAKLARRTT
jgi:phosphoglycerate dehydrogenase-like enzyme